MESPSPVPPYFLVVVPSALFERLEYGLVFLLGDTYSGISDSAVER